MRHGIGERTLKKTHGSGSCKHIATLQVSAQVGEHRMEASHLRDEVGLRLGPIAAADEKRARIAEHTRHVPDELRWRPYAGTDTKVTEVRGCVADCLLRSIGECGEKVPQERALVRIAIVHSSISDSIHGFPDEVAESADERAKLLCHQAFMLPTAPVGIRVGSG